MIPNEPCIYWTIDVTDSRTDGLASVIRYRYDTWAEAAFGATQLWRPWRSLCFGVMLDPPIVIAAAASPDLFHRWSEITDESDRRGMAVEHVWKLLRRRFGPAPTAFDSDPARETK